MLRSLGAVLLLALVAGAEARAADGQARFLVSATVPERVSIEVLEQPARLEISADDVVRGYKDVSARYVVHHSTERGWILQFSPRIGITRRVEVRGLPTDVVLERDGVDVYRPGTVGREALSLDYRLLLHADTAPGLYELPVHVAATRL